MGRLDGGLVRTGLFGYQEIAHEDSAESDARFTGPAERSVDTETADYKAVPIFAGTCTLEPATAVVEPYHDLFRMNQIGPYQIDLPVVIDILGEQRASLE